MVKFTYNRKVHLRDTDTFGVVYFARFFDFASEAFEAYLAENNLGIEKMDRDSEFVSPVTSAECKYIKPLKLGASFKIELQLLKENEHAVRGSSEIFDKDSNLIAKVSIVNTFVAKQTWNKIPIPESFHKLLS